MSTPNAVPSQEQIARIRTRWARTKPCDVFDKSRHDDICGDCGWSLHVHDIRDLLTALDATAPSLEMLFLIQERVPETGVLSGLRSAVGCVLDKLDAAERQLAEQAQELARLRALTTWQPIETAPKEREDILLAAPFNGRWLRGIGRWSQGRYEEHHEGRWAWTWCGEPTHWQPLPAAPRPEPTEKQSHG